MNIPFFRFFRKDKAAEGSVAVVTQPVTPIEKPSSERLGKTFIPNSSRFVGLESIGDFPVPPAVSSPPQNAAPAARKISLGGSGSIAVGPKISTNEPAAERTITLAMVDLIAGIPSKLLKAASASPEKRVVLRAAEVERGMANGRPAVLLRAIYNQAPEFFNAEVPATDLTEVALPFAKVVEQFASFQVRDDQIVDQECPQLQTPFLQVTIEDNKRFGKPSPFSSVLAARGDEPKPPVVAAAPPAISPPAPAAAETTPKKIAPIRLSVPTPTDPAAPGSTANAPLPPDQSTAAAPASIPSTPKPSAPFQSEKSAPSSSPAPTQAVKSTVPVGQSSGVLAAAPKPDAAPQPPQSAQAGTPMPTAKASLPLEQSRSSSSVAAKISPNGTGAPAAERVPASSGSPVPTPLPAPFAPLRPTRIPFKVTPPSNDLYQPPKFPAAQGSPDPIDFAKSGPRISLPLRNILPNVAPSQLAGSFDAVPDTAQIEIPFSIIEPQLSLGRIALSPAQFQAALPGEYSALFKPDPAGTPVPLSLQDVLQNLPSESLQLRGDQQELESGEAFETPFSQKADEDAARLKVAAAPIARKVAAPTQPTPKADAAPVKPAATVAQPAVQPNQASVDKSAPAAPAGRTTLQDMFDSDEPLDAKSVVGHVSRLPGVNACAIVFSDGLSLAGNIPKEYEADALCAMAPSIMKRIGEQMFGAKFGALNALTLFCAKMPVSLFAHGNICLAAIHSGSEIAAEVRDRLGRITQELARMYAQQPNA